MKKRTIRSTKPSAPASSSPAPATAGGSAPASTSKVSKGSAPSPVCSTSAPPPKKATPAKQQDSTSAAPTKKAAVVKEEPAKWASIDPRNQQNVEYASDVSAAIEKAYLADKNGKFDLTLGGMLFTIHFSTMQQKNQSGGSRKVVRKEPSKTVVEGKQVPKGPPPFTTAEIEAVLKVVEEVDKAVADLEKNEENRSYRLQFSPGKMGKNVKPVIDAFERIIAGFKMEGMKRRYGCDENGNDAEALALEINQPVPNYFANVQDQSIYHRKLLSLCGLRNLVLYGPEVFEEMRAKLFSGNPDVYAKKTGPHKMRYFTGNAVDLDFVVLRCNDKSMLAAVNATRKKHKEKEFKNGDELAKSDAGKQIAINGAKQLIDDFVARFKLSDDEIKSRHLDLQEDSLEIHKATDNKDRGKYPIWHYNNVGQSSYHVNVPNMPDIYGALLKAPYHLAKAMVLIFARYEVGSPEFVKAIEDFYEDAVADSCFNAKWKAIEEYCSSIEKKGSIQVLLSEVQQKHQDKFTPQFFADDPDRKKEEDLMVQLSSNTIGRDDSTGLTRKITPEDVQAWIKATD